MRKISIMIVVCILLIFVVFPIAARAQYTATQKCYWTAKLYFTFTPIGTQLKYTQALPLTVGEGMPLSSPMPPPLPSDNNPYASLVLGGTPYSAIIRSPANLEKLPSSVWAVEVSVPGQGDVEFSADIDYSTDSAAGTDKCSNMKLAIIDPVNNIIHIYRKSATLPFVVPQIYIASEAETRTMYIVGGFNTTLVIEQDKNLTGSVASTIKGWTDVNQRLIYKKDTVLPDMSGFDVISRVKRYNNTSQQYDYIYSGLATTSPDGFFKFEYINDSYGREPYNLTVAQVFHLGRQVEFKADPDWIVVRPMLDPYPADANHDGNVNLKDFLYLKRCFNYTRNAVSGNLPHSFTVVTDPSTNTTKTYDCEWDSNENLLNTGVDLERDNVCNTAKSCTWAAWSSPKDAYDTDNFFAYADFNGDMTVNLKDFLALKSSFNICGYKAFKVNNPDGSINYWNILPPPCAEVSGQ